MGAAAVLLVLIILSILVIAFYIYTISKPKAAHTIVKKVDTVVKAATKEKVSILPVNRYCGEAPGKRAKGCYQGLWIHSSACEGTTPEKTWGNPDMDYSTHLKWANDQTLSAIMKDMGRKSQCKNNRPKNLQ